MQNKTIQKKKRKIKTKTKKKKKILLSHQKCINGKKKQEVVK